MHAFLITGSTAKKRLQEAEALLKNFSLTEILRISPENSKHTISSVRSLTSSLQISPLNRDRGRGVILEEAHLLTQDAANAFLKTLEEPPPGNYLVLTAPTRESVLETIASRTAQIDLGAPDLNLSEKDLKRAEDGFNKIAGGGVGDRFTFVDSIKDRETALTFVVGQIYIVREKMLKDPALVFANLLDELLKTKTYLEANVNVKLALSELVLKYSGKD